MGDTGDAVEGRRRFYLDALDVPLWLPREQERLPDHLPLPSSAPLDSMSISSPLPQMATTAAGNAPSTSWGSAVGGDDLPTLRAAVAACTACGLHATRQRTVFGAGNGKALCMIIGEAPGADEDRLGEPFVGRAGKLLNAMLRALGLDREDVYITNMLKCRPPQNRDPKADEVAHCGHFLRRQIELIGPAVILALGRIAAQNLLGVETSLGRMRGQDYVEKVSGVPVVVTYHPAYLLRTPLDKRKAWVDLLRVRQKIDTVQRRTGIS